MFGYALPGWDVKVGRQSGGDSLPTKVAFAIKEIHWSPKAYLLLIRHFYKFMIHRPINQANFPDLSN